MRNASRIVHGERAAAEIRDFGIRRPDLPRGHTSLRIVFMPPEIGKPYRCLSLSCGPRMLLETVMRQPTRERAKYLWSAAKLSRIFYSACALVIAGPFEVNREKYRQGGPQVDAPRVPTRRHAGGRESARPSKAVYRARSTPAGSPPIVRCPVQGNTSRERV